MMDIYSYILINNSKSVGHHFLSSLHLILNAITNKRNLTILIFEGELLRSLQVTENHHRYLKEIEMREEGGTPDITGSIRAGLVFQLKDVSVRLFVCVLFR